MPLGINSDFFYPYLGLLIFSLMDLSFRSESFMNRNDKKLYKWSAKIEPENRNAMAELTQDFYYFLWKRAQKSF